MNIAITLKGVDELKAELARVKGQLPFTTSLALNRVANKMQGAVKANLASHFTLRRRPFIEGTVYRRKGTWPSGDNSSKASLTAALRINPERDVLVKYEEGGTKVSQSGHRLAIPLIRMLGNRNLVIGRSSRYSLKDMPTLAGASATSIKRAKRGPQTTFYATQTRKAGSTIIWESKGARTPPKPIWLLRPGGVPIAPRLSFHDTVQRTFDAVWVAEFARALDQALRTEK